MSHSLTHVDNNGIEHEFEVTFEPTTYKDFFVRIGPDGKKAVVGYLSVDSEPMNPRTECDNVGTMVCWHRRYNLGDETRSDDPEKFLQGLAVSVEPGLEDKFEWWQNTGYDREVSRYRKLYPDAEMYRSVSPKTPSLVTLACSSIEESINKLVHAALEKHYVILPLYLLDHSGLSMSTGGFNDPWDSGQVGWIYVDRETMIKEWGSGSKKLTKQIKERARNYLRGEVETYDQYLTDDVYGVCYQAFVRDGSVYEGECKECGRTFPDLINGAVCPSNECPSNEAPHWVEYSERDIVGYNGNGTTIYGDIGRDECWGYYGDKYAEEELKEGMSRWDSWLNTPTPPDNDPDQFELFGSDFQMAV